MFIKICTVRDEKPDITVIECDRVRFCNASDRRDEKDVRVLHIYPLVRRDEVTIQWLVAGDKMQVYLLNAEGKTIERLW